MQSTSPESLLPLSRPGTTSERHAARMAGHRLAPAGFADARLHRPLPARTWIACGRPPSPLRSPVAPGGGCVASGAPPPFLYLDTPRERRPMRTSSDCLDAFWNETEEWDGDDLQACAARLPMPAHCSVEALAPAERIAYRLINHAAEEGLPCPVNIDLEVAAGFNSTSMGPKLVRKLENRGLIRVSRYQRFRMVEIVATGKQTARHPSMRADRPLVRRGARSAGAMGLPGDRKPYAAR